MSAVAEMLNADLARVVACCPSWTCAEEIGKSTGLGLSRLRRALDVARSGALMETREVARDKSKTITEWRKR